MPARDLENRVMELEILITHLQRELAELNQVAIDQQEQINTLRKELRQLRGELAPGGPTVDDDATSIDDHNDSLWPDDSL